MTQVWSKDDKWRERYSKLYSSRRSSLLPQNEDPMDGRISFLSNEVTPFSVLNRDRQKADSIDLPKVEVSERPTEVSSSTYSYKTPSSHISWLSRQSEIFRSQENQTVLAGETRLLDLVRARTQSAEQELQEKMLQLPRDDDTEDEASSDACVHGLSMRMTERSMSRSRVSRMSTRRDMDIPSILAYAPNIQTPIHIGIPAFQKSTSGNKDDAPRWSIRRSLCPVCSQKWRDRSSISNVKNSGLKRNSTSELPTIIAPARLRTAITIGYVPRPALAVVDENASVTLGGMRNSSATWQLTRARKFRAPKPFRPSAGSAPACVTAPLARKDLDLRVTKFLTDQEVKYIP